MSVIVKHSSAFTPVNKDSKKQSFSHPFSIRNILNLEEKSNDEDGQGTAEGIDESTHPERASVITLPQAILRQDMIPLTYNSPEVGLPTWIYATRFCRQGIPPGTFINVRRPRKTLKKHKQRPLFSQKQIQRLEEEFANEKYISKSRRSTLAAEISLTDAQVRTWFQNRRTRWRKEVHSEDEICLSDVRHPWQVPTKQEHKLQDGYGSNSLIVRSYCCT